MLAFNPNVLSKVDRVFTVQCKLKVSLFGYDKLLFRLLHGDDESDGERSYNQVSSSETALVNCIF